MNGGRVAARFEDDGLLKIDGTLLHVYPFETRRSGDALSAPPRTVGLTCITLGRGDGGLSAIGDSQAFQVCLNGPSVPVSAEAAKEKVVLCNRSGDTYVYQADRQNQTASLCACGNATGAAAALIAFCLDRYDLRQQIFIPDARLEMRARISPARDGSFGVEQSWGGIQFQLQETRLLGRRVAVAMGTFNNYVFVLLPEDQRDRFDLDQALALWEAACPYGFDNPLRSRLAAIFLGARQPYVKFYTCGREHPGAPLTGLAALAMASAKVAWLAPVRDAGQVEHRRGVDALPAVHDLAIDFPAIHVLLHGARARLHLAA
jgi:hypothetical protein